MGWVTGFIMVIMAIGNFWFHSHLSRTVHHQQTAEITQQAADFIRYMNAINDYLYQHPERRAAGGQLTSAQLGLPATKNVSHLISQQRVFVWAKENPALWVPSSNKVVIRPCLPEWKTVASRTPMGGVFPSRSLL